MNNHKPIITITTSLKFQCICRQYSNALNNCAPEQFLEIGAFYPEMIVQEKSVDFYVELLRKDQVNDATY